MTRFAFVVVATVVLCADMGTAALVGTGTVNGVFQETGDSLDQNAYWLTQARVDIGAPFSGPATSGSGTDQFSWGVRYAPDEHAYYLDGIGFVSQQTYFQHPDYLTIGHQRLVPSTNLLQFSGADFTNQVKGEIFVLGTLYFENGVSSTSTAADSVALNISTLSYDEDFSNSIALTVQIISTPNVDGDEVASADSILFPDYPEYGVFSVYEGKATTVELLGEFNSLDFRGLGAVADPSSGFVSAVPEPRAWMLLGVVAFVFAVPRVVKRLFLKQSFAPTSRRTRS
ncbi:MAG: choice-of-anchor K domain-containing protein [Planctomycetales bacterium]|nr:choice-of-anchor K domain-containing protein [Planctomycetales bacterium]